jgi:hypothetical protein
MSYRRYFVLYMNGVGRSQGKLHLGLQRRRVPADDYLGGSRRPLDEGNLRLA